VNRLKQNTWNLLWRKIISTSTDGKLVIDRKLRRKTPKETYLEENMKVQQRRKRRLPISLSKITMRVQGSNLKIEDMLEILHQHWQEKRL